MTAVDLVPSWVVGSINLTDYPFSVDANSSVDIGEPEMVVEGVASLLADGDMEKVTRHGNRTYVLPVYIEGPTMTDLAQSEALLRAEIRKDGLLLTHDPGDGLTPSSAYEVWTAKLTPERRDDHESHLLRKFTLTLSCAPWAKSVDLTTITALTSSGSATTIDTCDSATGWTGKINGSSFGPADPAWLGLSGSVWVYDIGAPGPQLMELTRAGSFAVASPYLEVRIRANEPELTTVTATIDGVVRSLTHLAQFKETSTGDGQAFVFAISGTTVTSLTVGNYSYADSAAFGVSNVAFLANPPSNSPRQVTRIIEPGGTERTPASLRIEAANGTSALGLSIVHTSPEDGSGYTPPLRRWRTSGNTVTADASTASGSREPLHPAAVRFDVPSAALPNGGYLLCAFVRVATAGRYSVFFSGVTLLPPPNAAVGMGQVVNQVGIDFPLANTWYLVPLGLMELPTVRTSAGTVVISIQRNNLETVAMDIDEAWLFRVDDDCALSVGPIPAANLWLDSPDTSSAVPRASMGDSAATRTHPGGEFITGNHILHPDGTSVFAATLGGQYPKVSASFYKRWHSNAAE